MAGDWQTVRLGDVADVNWGDTSTTKASYIDEGVTAFSATGPDGFLPMAQFDRTGVVVSAIGAQCGRTWLARGQWSTIKNTLRFWSIDPEVDTEFLYWATREPSTWPRRGSAQPFISQGDARNVRVALPPLPEQRRIAHILGTLDDKIELNRRMNETLEEMAHAFFKSWFVDFEPVRAKAEGRDPGLPPHLADLFPDRLVDSELGEIPEGWEVTELPSLADVTSGGTPRTSVSEYWGGVIPWFSVVDAPDASDVWVTETEKYVTQVGVDSSAASIVPAGSTILSARGTVGKVALVGMPMAFNQSCYGFVPHSREQVFYTYFAIRELVATLKRNWSACRGV